jgi:hypothetical protein
MLAALAGFALLIGVSTAGVPIAFSMLAIGFAGFALFRDVNAASYMVGQIAFETAQNYGLSVLPMFVLMGNFINHARLSNELYDAANSFLGHRRGGLAMATIVACGGFAAVSGSSVATAATMARSRSRRCGAWVWTASPPARSRPAARPASSSAVGRDGDLRDPDLDRHRQALRRRDPAGPLGILLYVRRSGTPSGGPGCRPPARHELAGAVGGGATSGRWRPVPAGDRRPVSGSSRPPRRPASARPARSRRDARGAP